MDSSLQSLFISSKRNVYESTQKEPLAQKYDWFLIMWIHFKAFNF